MRPSRTTSRKFPAFSSIPTNTQSHLSPGPRRQHSGHRHRVRQSSADCCCGASKYVGAINDGWMGGISTSFNTEQRVGDRHAANVQYLPGWSRLPRITPANSCFRSECHVQPVQHRALKMVLFRKRGGWRTARWSSDDTGRHPWAISIHPLGGRNVLDCCCSAVDLRSSRFREQLRVALHRLSVCLWEETGDCSIRSTSQAKKLLVGIPVML